MAIKIGIISDTHGLLRPAVLEELRSCDYILHGGDVNKPEILDTLRSVAPLYVVRGNNDKEWAGDIPRHRTVTLGGVTFFMVHNKKDVPSDLGEAQVVVFGHSHKYDEQMQEGRLWLNPGSCGRRRFDQEITMAIMTIDGPDYQVQKLVFQP
ncbi:MAG: metallophosphoesterase family protein [Eubacteriales bacterium]|nr:metallophosphoesterase family protein [Eubacteriales bacterium]